MAIVQENAGKSQRWAQSVREDVKVGKEIEKAAKKSGINVSQLIRVGILRVLATAPTPEEIAKTATRPGPRPAPANERRKTSLAKPKSQTPQFAAPKKAASGKPAGKKAASKKADSKKPAGKKAAPKKAASKATGKQMEFPPAEIPAAV